MAADPRRLDHALANLDITVVHDDRGTFLRIDVPRGACDLCGGALKIEDHDKRLMTPCDGATRAARLKSLLAQAAPDDPATALARAAAVALSPSLVEQLHKSITRRIGASFSQELPPLALAARAAWMFGARAAVFEVNDEVAAANPPGAPEVIFLHMDGKAWEERTGANLEQWISWCQRAGAALWVAVPVAQSTQPAPAPIAGHGRAGQAGWGKVSRQVAARVAKARDRHWTGWLSSQARSRLLEVCEAGSFFDK